MQRISLQQVFRIGAGALFGAALLQPAQAAWPDDKPIEVVVGFAPGGGTDLLARKLAPFIQKRIGGKAQLIVVNKPGAAGEIGNAYLANAKADGYTIGIVNVPSFLYVPMIKKAQYKPEDIRLLARVVDDPTVLVVRSDSKYADLGSLVAALRKSPGSISFGHNGTGTNGELAVQLVSQAAKVEVNAVPFKGTSAQKTDLMGGHLDVAAISAGEVPELHGGKTGPVKVIAQLGKARSPALPQVPTATEAGVPALMSSERGFAAPKGVSADIARRLEAAIAEAVRDPEFAASNPADAPTLAYLPGDQWQASLDQNRKLLRTLADKAAK